MGDCVASLLDAQHGLSQALSPVLEPGVGRVELDLDSCSRIGPAGLGLLAQAIYRLDHVGCGICFEGVGSTSRTVVRHLNHLTRAGNRQTHDEQPWGDFLLRQINDENAAAAEVGQWGRQIQRWAGYSDAQAAQLRLAVMEGVSNSFQHGLSDPLTDPPVLMVGGPGRGRNQVQLALLDLGRSVPMTIAQGVDAADRLRTDSERIVLACRSGITCRGPNVRGGFGLPAMIDLLQSLGGDLLIVSRDGLVSTAGDRIVAHDFPCLIQGQCGLLGTLLVFNLPRG